MAPKPKGPLSVAKPAPRSAASKAAAKSNTGAPQRRSLLAAAKGVLGERGAPVPSVEAVTPAPAIVKKGVVYDGHPLQVKLAEGLFLDVTSKQMQGLSDSTHAEEQLPARMMLELVGDKNISWENASKSLRDGASFKNEILEMEGAKFVTRKSIERFEALGKLDPKALEGMNSAAFAMSVYLEAIIWAARENLGMNAPPALLPPALDEKSPQWPIWIDVKEIPEALAEALRWKRTPLFLCNGKAHVVDAFFSYQACTLVDAKWIMNKVDIKREMDVPQMREQLRSRLVSALKFGQPIHIAMSNSAVPLKAKYCTEAEFPESLFKTELWVQKDVHSKVTRDADLIGWPGAFPGRMKDDSASCAFVTSDFSLESAHEFLHDVLPFFEDMAIIQIDPTTVDA